MGCDRFICNARMAVSAIAVYRRASSNAIHERHMSVVARN
jgi:hypothetical protein